MLQGITKRCRLFWLTNSALAYEPKCGDRGGLRVSADEDSCVHGAQINFGDLTPYLTYGMLGPVKTMVVCDVGHRTVLDGRVQGLPLKLYR
jgi:hypothetical protein